MDCGCCYLDLVLYFDTVFGVLIMKYRFLINGIGIIPKYEFENLWQAFMWIYGALGENRIEELQKIEEVIK